MHININFNISLTLISSKSLYICLIKITKKHEIMTITLTLVEAARLSYLLSVGMENTNQGDIKEVGEKVEKQIQDHFKEVDQYFEKSK